MTERREFLIAHSVHNTGKDIVSTGFKARDIAFHGLLDDYLMSPEPGEWGSPGSRQRFPATPAPGSEHLFDTFGSLIRRPDDS